MPPRRPNPGQLDLLAWQAPEPVAAFDPQRVKAASLKGLICRAVSEALGDAADREIPREEVARRMGDYLGEKVSLPMLNAYASQAREEHTISLPRFIALLHATGDRRLLQMVAAPFNWAVVERKQLAMIELAAAQEHEDEARRITRELRARARAEGALT